MKIEDKIKKVSLIIIFCITLPSIAYSQHIILGVDFDLIDWDKICPNIKPLKLTLKSGKICKIAHPLDEQIYFGQFDNGIYTVPDNNVCEDARRVFEKYSKPYNGEWNHCRLKFSGTYRIIQYALDKVPLDKVILFRDKYLGSGVVDVGEVFKSRERIIKHNRKRKR